MLGVEAVDNILFGTPEIILNNPNYVNGRLNDERSLTVLKNISQSEREGLVSFGDAPSEQEDYNEEK